MFAASS